MAHYEKQDYAGAASALRAVSGSQPDFVAARFYLGVSLLLKGERIAGIQELPSRGGGRLGRQMGAKAII